jgi:hypothetical protein
MEKDYLEDEIEEYTLPLIKGINKSNSYKTRKTTASSVPVAWSTDKKLFTNPRHLMLEEHAKELAKAKANASIRLPEIGNNNSVSASTMLRDIRKPIFSQKSTIGGKKKRSNKTRKNKKSKKHHKKSRKHIRK